MGASNGPCAPSAAMASAVAVMAGRANANFQLFAQPPSTSPRPLFGPVRAHSVEMLIFQMFFCHSFLREINFCNFRGSEFVFLVIFSPEKMQKSRGTETDKLADFDTLSKLTEIDFT